VIIEVGDCVEQHLRVEIVSDTPEKIEAFRKAICDVILETGLTYDCAVSIHDCTPREKAVSKHPEFQANGEPWNTAPGAINFVEL